ncbi:GNAT family N-acetyltransferase [Kitasatospora sp. NPDC049258]|uniref:GNAT family N-acetyltransferase n=1 Tax=Kitasatospora sp. NPDC049258 TaxID=3155394 RepID=UPI003429E29E
MPTVPGAPGPTGPGPTGATDTGAPVITRLGAAELLDSADRLGELLTDAVAHGSSVGFLHPLDPGAAADWWRGLAAGVADGSIALWAACDGERLLGTVQLRLNTMPNSRHRAELAKLIVHGEARGRGLGRELLRHAERQAPALGVGLLLLDTQSGSPAERLYDSAGWTRLGSVPDYAADPAGVLRPTTFFHKSLA